MKNINYSFYFFNHFLGYFLLCRKKIWVPKDILDKIISLQNTSARTPNENLWDNWLGAFWQIVDIYNESDHKKYWVQKIEEMQKIFFSIWINFINGYLNYLHKSLEKIKEFPMNAFMLDDILGLEEEITEVLSILEEEKGCTDWKWLKEYIDTFSTRIDILRGEVIAFQNRSKNPNRNINQELKNVKDDAWRKFLHSGDLSLESIYNIQRNLKGEFPLSHTTKDIISSIQKNTTQVVPGIQALDLENKEILKALKAVQDKEADRANEFNLQLRNDLHTKFWAAANDELFYNSLWEMLSQKEDSDIVSLHIVWYEKFDIISFEKLPNSHHYKMQIEFQPIDSSETKIAVLYWDPEKIVAGQQARVGITQLDGSVKIHLLNINKIDNSWIRIKKETAYQKQKSAGFFSKTKNFFTKTYENFFSKKVV